MSTTFPRYRHLIIVFLLILLGQLLAGIFAAAGGILLGDHSDWLTQLLWPLGYLIGMAPAIRYTWKKGGRPSLRYRLTDLRNRKAIAAVLASFLALGFGLGVLIGYLPTAELIPEVGDTVPAGIGTAVMIIVLAPVLEEMLLRGLVLEQLLAVRSERAAILLSAVLFGLMHFVPAHIVATTVIGLALGYVYVYTRSLILVTLIHFFNNGVAYLGDVIAAPDPEWVNPYTEIPLAVLALVVGTLGLLRYTARLRPAKDLLRIETSEEGPSSQTLHLRPRKRA